ncbi:MAG: class I SAM-dependent methyltransferase [Verrucomicrobiota bacterium]
MSALLEIVNAPQPVDHQYDFREDYVTGWTWSWEKHLEPLAGKENIRLLEIGSFEGRSAIWFLDHIFTHPSSSIVCLDCFESGVEDAFDRNIAASGRAHRITKVKETSDSYLGRITNSGLAFDLIYVDGSHEAVHVLFDSMASWSLLKPGGIMILDDYGWEPNYAPHHRPRMAIDLFLEARGDDLEVIHHDYQVIVQKNLPAPVPRRQD